MSDVRIVKDVDTYAITDASHEEIGLIRHDKETNSITFEFKRVFGRFDAEITNALFDKYYDDDLKDNQLYTINHFCEILNSCGYAHVACTLWTADDARYDVIFQNGEIHVVNVKNDETVFRTSYTCVAWERTVIDREIVDRGG